MDDATELSAQAPAVVDLSATPPGFREAFEGVMRLMAETEARLARGQSRIGNRLTIETESLAGRLDVMADRWASMPEHAIPGITTLAGQSEPWVSSVRVADGQLQVKRTLARFLGGTTYQLAREAGDEWVPVADGQLLPVHGAESDGWVLTSTGAGMPAWEPLPIVPGVATGEVPIWNDATGRYEPGAVEDALSGGAEKTVLQSTPDGPAWGLVRPDNLLSAPSADLQMPFAIDTALHGGSGGWAWSWDTLDKLLNALVPSSGVRAPGDVLRLAGDPEEPATWHASWGALAQLSGGGESGDIALWSGPTTLWHMPLRQLLAGVEGGPDSEGPWPVFLGADEPDPLPGDGPVLTPTWRPLVVDGTKADTGPITYLYTAPVSGVRQLKTSPWDVRNVVAPTAPVGAGASGSMLRWVPDIGWQTIPLGAEGQVLRVTGSQLPAWSDPDELPVGLHAPAHMAGGDDPIRLDELAAPIDGPSSTLDATYARHGLLPKLSGVSGQHLNGLGAWAATPEGLPAHDAGTSGRVLRSVGAGEPVWSAESVYVGGGGSSGELAVWSSATTLGSLRLQDLLLDEDEFPRDDDGYWPQFLRLDSADGEPRWDDIFKSGDAALDGHVVKIAVTGSQREVADAGMAAADLVHVGSPTAGDVLYRGAGAWQRLGIGGIGQVLVVGASGLPDWDDASELPPGAHAATHWAGGADALKLDDLAAPDDNSDLNASTDAHGLLRKLSGDDEEYLGGDGAWHALPDIDALLPASDETTDGQFLMSNGVDAPTWEEIPYIGGGGTAGRVAVWDGGLTLRGEPFATLLGDFDPPVSGPYPVVLSADDPGPLATGYTPQWRPLINAGSGGDAGLLPYVFDLAGDDRELRLSAIDVRNVVAPARPTGGGQMLRHHSTNGWETFAAGSAGQVLAIAAGVPAWTDPQTLPPPLHAATHWAGGADALKLDDLAAPDDNTDLDATALRHGLLRKLNGDAGAYLAGNGQWVVPAVPKLDALTAPDDTTTLDATVARHGLLPKLPGSAALYLNGDGVWSAPPSGGASLPHVKGAWPELAVWYGSGAGAYLSHELLGDILRGRLLDDNQVTFPKYIAIDSGSGTPYWRGIFRPGQPGYEGGLVYAAGSTLSELETSSKRHDLVMAWESGQTTNNKHYNVGWWFSGDDRMRAAQIDYSGSPSAPAVLMREASTPKVYWGNPSSMGVLPSTAGKSARMVLQLDAGGSLTPVWDYARFV